MHDIKHSQFLGSHDTISCALLDTAEWSETKFLNFLAQGNNNSKGGIETETL